MPSTKFGPLPTQSQWESELRSCYGAYPEALKSSHPHLFIRESVAIRNLRINAVICGFEKSNELYKEKLEGFVPDEEYDGFMPCYEPSEDDESDGPLDGQRRRTANEKFTL